MFLSIIKKPNIIRNNQSGIALVLSVLVLTNLLMLTFIVTDVIIRIGKSSQQISQSEIAYFAAETASEQAMYEIEKNKDASTLGTPTATSTANLTTITDAKWKRYIEPVYETVVTCMDDNQKITYYPDINLTNYTFNVAMSKIYDLVINEGNDCILLENFTGKITIGNALVVILRPDNSFELDLDINSPADSDFYPNKIDINWRSYPSNNLHPHGMVIVLDSTGQTSYDTANATPNWVRIPATGNFGESPDYRFRIINQDSEVVMYYVRPEGGVGLDNKYLPIGIDITSKGYFKDKERIIEIERRGWEVY